MADARTLACSVGSQGGDSLYGTIRKSTRRKLLATVLQTSSAATTIDRLAETNERHLRELMTEYQNTKDPERIAALEREVDRAIIPQ